MAHSRGNHTRYRRPAGFEPNSIRGTRQTPTEAVIRLARNRNFRKLPGSGASSRPLVRSRNIPTTGFETFLVRAANRCSMVKGGPKRMPGGRRRPSCPDCCGGVSRPGQCAQCFGSGKRVGKVLGLNPTDRCEQCQGSGVCPNCGGRGSLGARPTSLGDSIRRKASLSVDDYKVT